MSYFVLSALVFVALSLVCALFFIKKERRVFKEEIGKLKGMWEDLNKNFQNEVLKEVAEKIKEIEGLCQACEFEIKHGKPHNLRPINDLSIHSCGQVVCPKCILNLNSLTPCSLCNETRRVSETISREYVPICGTEFAHFIKRKWEAPGVWTCSLKKGHKGECKP